MKVKNSLIVGSQYEIEKMFEQFNLIEINELNGTVIVITNSSDSPYMLDKKKEIIEKWMESHRAN